MRGGNSYGISYEDRYILLFGRYHHNLEIIFVQIHDGYRRRKKKEYKLGNTLHRRKI